MLSSRASGRLTRAPRPILVIGLTARTGTNYLARLLATHRDCTRPTALFEDYMVPGLRHLNRFIKQASLHWDEAGAEHKKRQLRVLLGRSLTQFLLDDARDSGKRPVFKTPSVWGLAHAHAFLPECDVIVLTRNGPDVVESGMRSFNWKFEDASRFWGESATYLVDAGKDRYRRNLLPFTIVRYEDLIVNAAPTLRSVFAAVGLSPDGFDFARASDFPLYGSSTERGASASVTWDLVEKPSDFDPLKRAQHWSEDAYRRFDWLTKGVSKELGYKLPFQFDDRKIVRYRYMLRDQKKRLPAFLQERFRYTPNSGSLRLHGVPPTAGEHG